MVRTVVRRIALCTALAAALPCQQPQHIAQRRLQHALQGFDEPLRRGEAVRELAWLGALALPKVKQLLAAADTPDAHRILLLQSLAAMGKEGLPALPLCQDLLASADERMLRAALSAIENVAPYADAGTRSRLQQAVAEQWSRSRPLGHEITVAQLRTQWGATVPVATIVEACSSANEVMLAAMRAIAAGCVPCSNAERTRLLGQLRPMLVAWMLHPGARLAPGLVNGNCAAAIAGAMRRLGAVEDQEMLRAFLWHPDQAERLRAVMLLADVPRLSSDRQRDIAACLGDAEMPVAVAAAGALARLGSAALPSLGALLQQVRDDRDGPVGTACSAAVARIFAAMRPVDTEAAALADDLWRLCCGGEAKPGVHWQGAAASRQWAQLVRALGGSPAAQTALLRAGVDCGMRGSDVVDTAMSVLTVQDQQVWEAALGLLAAQGRDAAAAATGAESPLLLFLSCKAEHASPRDVHECLAWILAGPDASVADLQRGLAHDDARVALRAAVELATRGTAMTPGLADALRQLAQRERQPGWPGGLGIAEAYLWQRARAVAALQLALGGQGQLLVGYPASAVLAELVADVLVVDPDEVPQELQRLARDGLGDDARAMERDGREKLLPARRIGPPR